MRILLICAGGMSTSILMRKLETYAGEKGFPLSITARGIGDYEDVVKDFDVILLGPQVSYQKANVEEASGLPVGVIAPYDYAVGNCEPIFAEANQLIGR